MKWFWPVAEVVVFLALAISLAVYTGKPVWVFGIFLLLTIWELVRLVRGKGW